MAVETDFHAAELPAWAHLEELKGSRRLPLRHVRCLVGRAVDVDVNLPVQEVSRYHALIWREASGVWVADLGSVNGTYADGRPARDPVAVHDGSVLAFGPAAFTFRAG
jgi:pSer/pThr/pTyr-binding forkhead associated (FHA) protein